MPIVQVRDVPEATYARLRERAAAKDQSLSEFLRAELETLAGRPTLEEMLERIGSREPVEGVSAAELIRQERDLRDVD